MRWLRRVEQRENRVELDPRFGEVYIPDSRPMDATRARVSSLVEWLVAFACLLAAAALGAMLMGDIGTVTALTPVIAREEALPDPPAAVPPRSVSVPVILLADGSELRVGDEAAAVSARLGVDAEVAPPAIDRATSGERVTRFYAQNGQRFVVVLQAVAGDGQVRVAAIYLPAAR
jgi:hypothetical protein